MTLRSLLGFTDGVRTGLDQVYISGIADFVKTGYAWPLHSIVEGSRQILFDLHSRIGLDFGILIAWGAVNTAFFPFCCWFQRKLLSMRGILNHADLYIGWKTQKKVNEYWPMN